MFELLAAFGLFLAGAVSDGFTGRVNILLLLVPVIITAVTFPALYVDVFLPIFGLLALIWCVIYLLQKRGKVPADKVYLGTADVVAVPLAMHMAAAAFPAVGPAVFAGIFALMMPIFLRRRTRRLLPWLVPPTAAALLVGLLL